MYFTEQHELIKKLAREFAEKELTKEVLDKMEETHVFPDVIRSKMEKAGFFGIKIPKELGGPLLLSGTEEQIEKYLKPVVKGEKIMSFCMTEPGAECGH